MCPSDTAGSGGGPGPGGGWVFLSPELVPEGWRERAIPVALVPLTREEGAQILAGSAPRSSLDPGDTALLRVLAGGGSRSAMARELGLTVRALQYRLARLRARFGVESTTELVALAAGRGFGGLGQKDAAVSQEGELDGPNGIGTDQGPQ